MNVDTIGLSVVPSLLIKIRNNSRSEDGVKYGSRKIFNET